jgi:hypothetical protein
MEFLMQLYGLDKKEVHEALTFYQKFKNTPTYAATLKQIKREHLEAEITRINKELGEL